MSNTTPPIGIKPDEYESILANLADNEVLDDLECSNMHIISKTTLYRFTSDSVRLANLVRGKYRDKLLDMCSGGGIISMLVAAKTNISSIVGIELQPELHEIATRSAMINNLYDRVSYINDDIMNLTAHFPVHSMDIITCNPPYYKVGSGESRLSPSAAIARHEVAISIDQIISQAALMLKYGGYLYMVHKCDRMAEVISLLTANKLEPKELYTYTPSGSANCDTFIVIAKANGKSGLIVKSMNIES